MVMMNLVEYGTRLGSLLAKGRSFSQFTFLDHSTDTDPKSTPNPIRNPNHISLTPTLRAWLVATAHTCHFDTSTSLWTVPAVNRQFFRRSMKIASNKLLIYLSEQNYWGYISELLYGLY